MTDVSLVGYADIGSQPGQDFTELANALFDERILSQAYCRGIEGTELPEERVTTPIPFGRRFPRLINGIGRHVYDIQNRYYSEYMFDYYSAKRISKTDDIQLHFSPGYPKTLEKGKEHSDQVIVRTATEYEREKKKRLAPEYKKYTINSYPIPKKRIKRREETINKADKVIAISKFVKESLINGGVPENKIDLAPFGVNSDDYPTKTEDIDKFTVLFIGSININKGVPYLLDAWQKNGWEYDNEAQLILGGRISPELEEIIEEKNINNLKTPGYVEPRNYYQNASVFCFPSLSEGFGKVILEAMASGLPVISTEYTGARDVMTDGEEGYIVETRDSDVIANKLQYLRDNPEERKQMGDKALQTAKENPWDKHTNKIIDIISDDNNSK
ncbi:glycosyl transferase group 1 [Halorhabdus utahensis DSM 12940]|uniref:Glycosyl transferase group 1 n=1 Tax=Halorhabdus utahensis (strain DSM 12940 / JCM 11049 / AX-2) TaxID=519442 RepID=C7NM91_HALUD|nr:glycosyltransferase family 4 protein [Halorhabdus utahensis]ACV11299.1 glycosyl transferase group 1 [Halorhabdus utahensis DSM 12940]